MCKWLKLDLYFSSGLGTKLALVHAGNIQAYIGALETLTLTKAENERTGGDIPGSLPDCGL